MPPLLVLLVLVLVLAEPASAADGLRRELQVVTAGGNVIDDSHGQDSAMTIMVVLTFILLSSGPLFFCFCCSAG
jgi:hypothetical protein